jgi:ubiquinone/menaquinone biosynthesis C-methylase UbiE
MRKRLFAWLLSRSGLANEPRLAERKRALIGRLRGDVVEIGPGAGANMPYFDPAVRWVGVEPNPHMDRYLEREAARAGIRVEIRRGRAERLPFADRSVDAVVATHVLCSVEDPAAALAEARRVLRPGGRLVFLEHVGAPAGTFTRRVQAAVRPIWGLCADGCRPDRDTERLIRAAGFAEVQVERFGLPLPVVGPHVAGVAFEGA